MAASCRAEWRNGLIPILELRYVNVKPILSQKYSEKCSTPIGIALPREDLVYSFVTFQEVTYQY